MAAMTPEEIANILWLEAHGELEAGIEAAKAELDDASLSVTPERALRFLADHIMQFSADLIDNEREAVKSLVLDAVERGTGAKKLASAIRGSFSEGIHYVEDGQVVRTMNLAAWAETVSRTELSRAYNQGARDLYDHAGITERVWVTAGDAHECPACEAADGEIVKIGNLFPSVNVEDAPAHPRCFCVCMGSPVQVAKYRSPEQVARRRARLAKNRAYSAAHGGRMG